MAVRRDMRETAVEIAVHITGTRPDGSWRDGNADSPGARTAEVAELIEAALDGAVERAVQRTRAERGLRERLAAGIEWLCSRGYRLAARVR